MPRASGSFTPPSSSWYPATSGNAAAFGDWNTLLADLSSALTQSISQDGQTNPTANLPMSGFKHTGAGSATGSGQYIAWGQSCTLGAVTLGAITGTAATFTTLNGGQFAGLRNRVMNGSFAINQRAVSGTVTLAAGIYGHDRWRAGAAGCTYTFATANNVTTLTISAGSLQQVVEGLNLESGTYALSWTGTATGKIGAGVLSASGVSQAVTGGTDTAIEISTGTLSKVQIEIGSATAFEQRPIGLELALCQRYCFVGRVFIGSTTSYVPFPVQLRTTVSGAVVTGAGAGFVMPDAGSSTGLICSQTSGSGQTITVSAEL